MQRWGTSSRSWTDLASYSQEGWPPQRLEWPGAAFPKRAQSSLKTSETSAHYRRFLAVFVVLSFLSTLWALASPLMSAPDEQAHVIKAASVVRGQLQGESGGAQGEKARVDVPLFIAATDALPACFASKPAVSAACSPQLPSDATVVTALTSAGNYNPLYYAMAGVPSLFFSGAEAIYAMRIVGALLASAFLALALINLAGLRQWRISVLVGFIALTPMVLFLAGAVNPNALEIATAMAVFCGLCFSWERIQENNS